MKIHLVVATAAALLLSALPAQAAQRTVTLAVHHASCTLCGPIVRKSLEAVKGVEAIALSEPDATATITAKVTFDDASTSAPQLIAATTKAGYPSNLKQSSQLPR